MTVPAGLIAAYAADADPTGWLRCNGASLLRASYPSLFTAIGTVFGSADGTHFTLPDLQGRVILGTSAAGTGSSLGETGGSIDHTHSGASHTHPVTEAGTHTAHAVTQPTAHGMAHDSITVSNHSALTHSGFASSSTHTVSAEAGTHSDHASGGAHTHDAHTTIAKGGGAVAHLTGTPATHSSVGGHAHGAHGSHSGSTITGGNSATQAANHAADTHLSTPTGAWTINGTALNGAPVTGDINETTGTIVMVANPNVNPFNNNRIRSTDGPTGTLTSIPVSSASGPRYIATDGAGNWLAAGDTVGAHQKPSYSTDDGATWSVFQIDEDQQVVANVITGIAYGNGYWVMCTSNCALQNGGNLTTYGNIWYCTTVNGTWVRNLIEAEQTAALPGPAGGGMQASTVRYASGYWVVAGSICQTVGTGSKMYYRASDPTGAWTKNTSLTTSSNITSARYGNGYWCMTMANGHVLTRLSADPTGAFTDVTTGASQLNDIAYGNSNFVAVGTGGMYITGADPTTGWAANSGETGSQSFVLFSARNNGFVLGKNAANAGSTFGMSHKIKVLPHIASHAGMTATSAHTHSGSGTGSAGSGTTGTGNLPFMALVYIISDGSADLPVGAVANYGSTTPPAGWIAADGASQLRATYPDLFTAIGTVFGSVDGTHFNVPDMSDRHALHKASAGTGSTFGETGGSVGHTHSTVNHTHSVAQPSDHGSHTIGQATTHTLSHTVGVSDHAALAHSSTALTGHTVGQPGAHTNHIADANSGGHTHDSHTSTANASSGTGAGTVNAPITHASAWASGDASTHTHTDAHTHSGQDASAHSITNPSHAAAAHTANAGDHSMAHAAAGLDAHSAHASQAQNGSTGSGTSGAGNAPYLVLQPIIKTAAAADPVGILLANASASLPANHVVSNGASVLRAGTYAALFAVYSTTFGSADGTHFTLPDLRGRIPLGKSGSTSLNDSGGSRDHTHTGPAHTHASTQAAAHSDHTPTQPSAHSTQTHSIGLADHPLVSHTESIANHTAVQASAHGTHSSQGGHTHDNHTGAVLGTTGSGTTRQTGPTTHSSDGAHTHDAHSAHSGFAIGSATHTVTNASDHAARSHTVTAQPSDHTTGLTHSGFAVDAHSPHSGFTIDSAGSANSTGTANPPYMSLDWVILYATTSGTIQDLAVTGGATPAGSLIGETYKRTSGAFTPAGSAVKQVSRALSGSATPHGSVTMTPIRGFAAGLTPTGTLQKAYQAQILPTASIASAGAVVQQPQVVKAGTGASSGQVIRQTQRLFVGGFTPAGAVIRQIQRLFAGSIAPSGALFRAVSDRLNGSVASSGALVRQTQIVRPGAITPTGAKVLETSRLFAGATTPAGSVIRTISRIFAGSVASAGALVEAVSRVLSGSLTSSGRNVLQAQLVRGGSVTPAGRVVREIQRLFAGSVTMAGSVFRAISTAYAGTIASAGRVVDQVNQRVSGSTSSSGSVGSQPATHMAGSMASSGSVIDTAIAHLSGAETPSGTVINQSLVVRLFEGSIAPSGALIRQANLDVAGALTPHGSIVLLAQRSLAGVVAPSGSLLKTVPYALSGALTPSGAVTRAVAQQLAGAAGSSGATRWTTHASYSGSVLPTAGLDDEVSKILSGLLTLSGELLLDAIGNDVLFVEGAIGLSGALIQQVRKSLAGVLHPTSPEAPVTPPHPVIVEIRDEAAPAPAKSTKPRMFDLWIEAYLLLAGELELLVIPGTRIADFNRRVALFDLEPDLADLLQ